MIPALLMTLALATQSPVSGIPIDAPTFFKLIQDRHGAIRDLSFVYEGVTQYVGPAEKFQRKGKPETFGHSYRGTFAERHDKAILIDIFEYPFDEGQRLQHRTFVEFRGRFRSALRIVDHPVRIDKEEAARHYGLMFTGSPVNFVFLDYFRRLAGWYGAGYRYGGWEDVDGHHCLVVDIDLTNSPRPDPKHPYHRFWIDLDRGGHPLKMEDYWGAGKLAGRIDKIRLARVVAPDGQSFWIPVSGEENTFLGGSTPTQFVGEPVFRETYSVETDTIRVNRGLADALFSLDRQDGLPESERLKAARGDFEAARKAVEATKQAAGP